MFQNKTKPHVVLSAGIIFFKIRSFLQDRALPNFTQEQRRTQIAVVNVFFAVVLNIKRLNFARFRRVAYIAFGVRLLYSVRGLFLLENFGEKVGIVSVGTIQR